MPDTLAHGFLPEAGFAPPTAPPEGEPETIIIVTSDAPGEGMLSESGALHIKTEDGGVVIDLDPQPEAANDSGAFDENIAEKLSAEERNRIAADLLMAIQADEQSRSEWLETRAKGIDMLGFKIEEPQSGGATAGAPLDGMSRVRHPLLPEAVIRFQSNASAELLPAQGPVKVRNDDVPVPAGAKIPGGAGMAAASSPGLVPPGLPGGAGLGHNGGPPLDDPATSAVEGLKKDEIAEALEKDLNHYLTVVDKGYRPDTDRMLFWVGFGGVGFKKVYHDPIRRMPLSRSVDAKDLIVSHAANDIDDAGRVTHRIEMRRSQLVRMQMAGVYRSVPGITSTYAVESPNAVDLKERQVQGINSGSRPEDHLYTVYEAYVELDIRDDRFRHKGPDGKPSGLEVPYRVSIEKESREILEIRRNWREDDADCMAKKVWVKFPFVPAFGFYEIGLLQILGNTDKALTAAWRLMLDSGMFNNFPGFLYNDMVGRQQTNDFRVGPGQGARVQTGATDIRAAVMPLPYKGLDAGFVQLIDLMAQGGQRLGGTAELPVGEGKQDAPVGTTLALIEQAGKMLAAVHIRLHAAQAEEFTLLKERFREDPEAFFRAQHKKAKKWERDEFLAALEDCDIVPAADPNTPSHMHRMMKAVALKQLQMASPQLYDLHEVDSYALKAIGIMDPESMFAPPAPPPQPQLDPNTVLAVQAEKAKADQEAQVKQAEIAADSQGAQADRDLEARKAVVESAEAAAERASREKIAAIGGVVQLATKGVVDGPTAISAVVGSGQQPPKPFPPLPTPPAHPRVI